MKKEDGKEHVDNMVELDSYSYSTLPKYFRDGDRGPGSQDLTVQT